MTKWFGSVTNRLEEDRMYCDTIEVGTGVTEYSWSDRHPYEVVAVKDQKHVSVRALDHEAAGPCYSNDWKLTSNPNNPVYDLVKRGNYWYWSTTVTLDELNSVKSPYDLLPICVNGFDPDVIRAKGKQTKLKRARVSFGVAEYYFDYEF